GLPMRLHHLRHRDTGVPKTADNLVAGALLTPGPQMRVDKVVALASPRHGRQRGIHCPLRSSEHLAQALPLPVCRDGDRDPAVEPTELVDIGGAVKVLRSCPRSPISGALQ